MSNSPERNIIKFPVQPDGFQRRIQRTQKAQIVKSLGLAGVLGAAAVVAGVRLNSRVDYTGKVDGLKDYVSRQFDRSLNGELVSELEGTDRDYITLETGGPIIIRSQPELGEDNIVGFAAGGQDVKVSSIHVGSVYPSDKRELGNFMEQDGISYGKWFKVESIGVIDDEGVMKVEKGVYVSGNFLTKVESLH